MNDARLTALEELIAHQGKTIEELSDEIARQARALALAEHKITRLTERFMTLEDAAAAPQENKRPPHW
jgi:SlyX protein